MRPSHEYPGGALIGTDVARKLAERLAREFASPLHRSCTSWMRELRLAYSSPTAPGSTTSPPELPPGSAASSNRAVMPQSSSSWSISGLDAPPSIDDRPPESPPIHALSLAVAQKCNLGCSYCYARQGTFGGTAKAMSADTAKRSVDLLMDGKEPGSRVNLAFLGGEPLANRAVIRDATRYAVSPAPPSGRSRCGSRSLTNGTLVTRDDGEFFEEHGFAVTVSLDGIGEQHDLLRPFRDGSGSYQRIIDRIQPLLSLQRKMQISARVTVTPAQVDLPDTLDKLIELGFYGVGFSPLLRSSSGHDEMDAASLAKMLEGLIACGLEFERRLLARERYPFLNMVNALRELQKGTHRPYPCGAGAGYFGVSADGDLAACHRFVGDDAGAMGDLTTGLDETRRDLWLSERHVHRQEPCRSCWALLPVRRRLPS